jgi:hypothetical protein
MTWQYLGKPKIFFSVSVFSLYYRFLFYFLSFRTLNTGLVAASPP